MPAYQSATNSGFVPNSVLVKILWPPPPLKSEKSQESWRPPSLSEGQLSEIEKEKVCTDFLYIYIHVFQTINAINCYLKVFVVFVVAVFEFSVYADFPKFRMFDLNSLDNFFKCTFLIKVQ